MLTRPLEHGLRQMDRFLELIGTKGFGWTRIPCFDGEAGQGDRFAHRRAGMVQPVPSKPSEKFLEVMGIRNAKPKRR